MKTKAVEFEVMLVSLDTEITAIQNKLSELTRRREAIAEAWTYFKNQEYHAHLDKALKEFKENEK